MDSKFPAWTCPITAGFQNGGKHGGGTYGVHRSHRSDGAFKHAVDQALVGVCGGRIAPFHSFPYIQCQASVVSWRYWLVTSRMSSCCWDNNDRFMRQHYGYRYHYENNSASPIDDGVLPPWLLHWARFIHSFVAAHGDSPRCFGPEIVTISLVSSCEFLLTHARDRRKLSHRLGPWACHDAEGR